MSRNIFEEVDQSVKGPSGTGKTGPNPSGISRVTGAARRWMRAYLAVLFVMVAAMIAIGGMTRLTDSGLSIVEWAPISGAIPPLSDDQWQQQFTAYQQTTEYQQQNRGMSMAEFKYIFWWEWGHRQWGRAIGFVWAVGFAALALSGNLIKGWVPKIVALGALGGLQGAIGWWMVYSGLAPGMFDVASYRLATHLGVAFFILALITWFILQLSRPAPALLAARRAGDKRLFGMTTGLLHLTFLQVLVGALVAGIDAGRNYIDWPLMAGGFTPPDMWAIDPWYRNLFENDGTVQFIHRMLGYLVFAYGIAVWLKGRKSGNALVRQSYAWMGVMLFGQVVIGIVTVMHSAPIALGLTHQLGAVALVVLILRARFLAIYPPEQSLRGAAA